MSRQITIGRDELDLDPLNLNDPEAGYYVSDNWTNGGVVWQRYNAAASPWVHGDRVVGQRMTAVEETFTVYVYAPDPTDLRAKIETIAEALSQYRYTLDITWDGDEYNYTANGAGELHHADAVDPVLHRAGWVALQLTIPRDPGV